jgi:hypothetical protein
LLVVADVALMVAFTVPLMVINSRFGRYCRNQINDVTIVQQCYPDAYSSLVASIAAVEPLHILVDIGLFTFGIVYAMFGSKRASTDHWDGLLAILAFLALLGRIVGTIGTVFMLPGEAASNTTSTAMFQAALGTASGTFIGLESFFLLLMLLGFARDLYRRHDNLSSAQ